jgi:outer membrane receptor for ferrienterochelin and colicin
MDRTSVNTDSTISRLIQTGSSQFSREGFQSGLGFNWDLTPKNTITLTLDYNYLENSNIGSSDRQTILQDISQNQLSDEFDSIYTANKIHEYSFDFGLSYKKKFKKKDQELEVLFNTSNGNKYSYYEQTQRYVFPDAIFNSSFGRNPGIETESYIAVNYAQPLVKNGVLETGAKIDFDHINSKSDVYLLNLSSGLYDFDTSQSSSAINKRIVYAVYLSATFKLFNLLDIKTGCREEYTVAKADFSNSGMLTMSPYNTLVPSMIVSHTFNNKQTLKISYSRRIQRPNYSDLDPFINASDPKNITTGNPNLHPEISDKVELGYFMTLKKGITINPTIFYRGNIDDIQSYTRYFPVYIIGDSTYTNVAISTRENIGREDNFGLNLFASISVTQKLNLRTNISCFERTIMTGMSSGGNIHGFSYRTNINISYQPGSTLIFEFLGNFNSARINAQGKMPSFISYNFAIRKQLFDKKGSIAITATNFFDKYVYQKTELSGQNFKVSNSRQLPYRSFGFNFTYKFGKVEFGKEKVAEDINLTDPAGN